MAEISRDRRDLCAPDLSTFISIVATAGVLGQDNSAASTRQASEHGQGLSSPQRQTRSEDEELIRRALNHGLEFVIAPDGITAIQIKITRDTGETVTWLIAGGASGLNYEQLADYGREKLHGATLLTHDDFIFFVQYLDKSINLLDRASGYRGRDPVLSEAYQVTKKGVRTEGNYWSKRTYNGFSSLSLTDPIASLGDHCNYCTRDMCAFYAMHNDLSSERPVAE